MANYGTTAQQRSSATSPPPTRVESAEGDESPEKIHFFDFERIELRLICPLRIPSSPEAASLRIINNLSHFALFYAHFIWIILLITLIPERKVSLIVLVILTYVASLYSLLLRAFPASYLLHKVIDKRAVMGLIAVGAAVGLIVTESGLHLVLTLAGTLPVVLLHAVLWVREILQDDEEAIPLVNDHEPTCSV